ncbi:Exonuclease 3'-5' domain-containing protein 2 [Armadillidium nasatum]|uniref:Exonuclease 3'-5' domain-containing protein 2 n=1 Tax=Armadillidium nasatum TaxID=96803 RepID=A0A5N5TCN0_9CRUS|nr:Exonuclease 3'-5' domain-containing protein 2 [Armadillidium nasatum]
MYAAEDAIVGIRILLAQLKNLWKPVLEESLETSVCKAIEEVCEPFVEVEFDHEKMKFCFVCGNKEVSVLKNVVPEEYMKYFPPIVELDSNRSLILLCNQCNESNSIKEENLRRELAEEFDAPIEDASDDEETVVGKLQAVYAARILKGKVNNLTEGQINFLQRVLRKFYKTNTLTEDLINQAADMSKEIISEGCNLHSYKVLRYYEKVGLFHILTRWRQWFQDSMKPKYLPEYWQISSEQWWLQLRRKMHQYPLDSEVRGLYKLILVGRDGDINVPYQPNTQVRDNTCSGYKPKKDFGRVNELNLSSTGQSRDQT